MSNKFKFPKKHKLKTTLEDYLDSDVDARYFYDEDKVKDYVRRIKEQADSAIQCQELF